MRTKIEGNYWRPMQNSQKKHFVERCFVSTRGLHFCFQTYGQAKAAYEEGLSLGFPLVLEDCQLIDTRLQPKKIAVG